MDPLRLRAPALAALSSLALVVPAGLAGAQTATEPEPAPGEAEPGSTEPVEGGEPATTEAAKKAAAAAKRKTIKRLRQRIRAQRKSAWHWQRVMGKERKPTAFAERRTRSVDRLRHLRDRWRKIARRTRSRARDIPYRSAWLCIKRHEGAWDDPNAPYWGGLQMDMTFQRMYGRYLLRKKGTADRWRPLEQMWTAEKARRSGRGFHPWPNTARYCGLL